MSALQATQAAVRPIPESEWLWHGHAGHLVVSHDCEFHLNTRVGNYRISTIGDWFPDGWPRGNGVRPKEIGIDRTHETFVFRVDGPSEGDVTDLGEIDTEVYNDCEAAVAGHLAMCRKWAAR